MSDPTKFADEQGAGKRVQKKQKTQKAILNAALELFAERGFHGTTTKEISKRARIAEGTLFNYFKTKEDLALFFLEQEVMNLIAWYGDQDDLRSTPITEKLFAIIHHHLESIRPYEEFIGAVYLRALQPGSKLNPLSLERYELNYHYLKFIRDVLNDAEDAGEIPGVGDLGAYAVGLFHLAIVTHWLHDPSDDKEATVAVLDRSLNLAGSFIQKGSWEW